VLTLVDIIFTREELESGLQSLIVDNQLFNIGASEIAEFREKVGVLMQRLSNLWKEKERYGDVSNGKQVQSRSSRRVTGPKSSTNTESSTPTSGTKPSTSSTKSTEESTSSTESNGTNITKSSSTSVKSCIRAAILQVMDITRSIGDPSCNEVFDGKNVCEMAECEFDMDRKTVEDTVQSFPELFADLDLESVYVPSNIVAEVNVAKGADSTKYEMKVITRQIAQLRQRLKNQMTSETEETYSYNLHESIQLNSSIYMSDTTKTLVVKKLKALKQSGFMKIITRHMEKMDLTGKEDITVRMEYLERKKDDLTDDQKEILSLLGLFDDAYRTKKRAARSEEVDINRFKEVRQGRGSLSSNNMWKTRVAKKINNDDKAGLRAVMKEVTGLLQIENDLVTAINWSVLNSSAAVRYRDVVIESRNRRVPSKKKDTETNNKMPWKKKKEEPSDDSYCDDEEWSE
jgi:hypothetical protein